MACLEKILGFCGKVLLMGTLAFSPLVYMTGCEKHHDDSSDETNSVPTNTGGSGGNDRGTTVPNTNSSDNQTPENVTANFAINYPVSGGTALYEDTMTGAGIKKPVKSYFCSVTTDHPYLQVGSLHVKANGTWSYYPIYFGGDASLVDFQLTYDDGTGESAKITDVHWRAGD